MGFIKGTDLMFYVYINGQPIVFCHCRTCTLNTTAPILPTTTYQSGNANTFEYSKKYSYTIKGEGLNYIGDQIDNFSLQEALRGFQKIDWTFTDNKNVQYYGTVLVTTTTIDSDFSAVSTFEHELQGDGEYTFIRSETPPIPPTQQYVTIEDQLGNILANVPAPSIYTVTKFDTIDLHDWNPTTLQPITPQIVITQS